MRNCMCFFGAKIPHDAGFVINLEQTIEEL